MKCLIVEDEIISSLGIGKTLSRNIIFDAVVNGKQATPTFLQALEINSSSDLINGHNEA